MTEWISVEEESPSKEYPILIWNKWYEFPISVKWLKEGTYGESGFFDKEKEYETKEKDITHWMPLPELPKD